MKKGRGGRNRAKGKETKKEVVKEAVVATERTLADQLADDGIIATCSMNARGVHENFRDINVLNFSITYFGKVLLEDSDLSLNYGRRYGFLGLNGSGKSTTMNVIGARGIPIPENIDIYHLKHEIEPSDMTALESVLAVDDQRVRWQKEADRLTELLGSEDPDVEVDTDEVAERLNEAYERLEELDADTAELRARGILSGLTFSDAMMNKKTKEFSGGWRMRIALARVSYIFV